MLLDLKRMSIDEIKKLHETKQLSMKNKLCQSPKVEVQVCLRHTENINQFLLCY